VKKTAARLPLLNTTVRLPLRKERSEKDRPQAATANRRMRDQLLRHHISIPDVLYPGWRHTSRVKFFTFKLQK
jgi:hypothetical protein